MSARVWLQPIHLNRFPHPTLPQRLRHSLRLQAIGLQHCEAHLTMFHKFPLTAIWSIVLFVSLFVDSTNHGITMHIDFSEKMKNSSPKKLSADCWPTVGRQSTDSRPTVVYRLLRKSSAGSRPTVGRLSVICWPSVGWEPLSNTRKASARREEHCISTRNETFSLESAILFWFF